MENTTLDDLKRAWKELSQQLERQNTTALLQTKENKRAGLRFGLRPLLFGQLVQLMIGALIAVFSTQFWVNHMATPVLLICGLLLQAYGIMFIAFAVRDFMLIRQIDYAAPVVEIQKQLADLRAWHLRAAVWFCLTGSVIWLPMMLIVLYLLGANPFWIGKPHGLYWLISTAAVCLALCHGMLLLARSPGQWGRCLRDSWIGRSVNRAQEMLDEVEQFEREPT